MIIMEKPQKRTHEADFIAYVISDLVNASDARYELTHFIDTIGLDTDLIIIGGKSQPRYLLRGLREWQIAHKAHANVVDRFKEADNGKSFIIGKHGKK